MIEYNLLKTISRFLFPYILIFGVYIIVNGDLSPGGGFQGGVVLASSYFLIYFVKSDNILDISTIFKMEKILFLILIILAILNFYQINFLDFFGDRTYLILLNLTIGIKVSLGIGGIISIYLTEGSI